MITQRDVEAARERVAGYVRRTPMLALDDTFGGTGWFKLEYLQHTGTFKVRGASRYPTAKRQILASSAAGG